MAQDDEIQEPRTSFKPLVIALLILAASGGAGWWILNTGPKQEKVAKPATVPSVEVQPLVASHRKVSIEAFGTVQPAREVTLTPEVEGRVIKVHDQLEPGAIVRQGELLLRIDPAEYRIAVRRAEAALQSARASLAMEVGQKTVAAREWELFAQQNAADPNAPSPSLALREPQMKQAQAQVATAEAVLEEARLLQRRTDLRVPFDAFVSEESLEVGRRVSPATPVATLVGIAEFWATVTLPVDQADRLNSLAAGAPVKVSLATGLGDQVEREGTFVRRLPGVEAEGRMARALIAIADPLGTETGAPSLPLGSYVRVAIDGGELSDAFEIPREALRENGQVWVRDGAGKLQFRDVRVVWRRDDVVYVRAEFAPDDALVTNYLADPLPGIDVRIRETP